MKTTGIILVIIGIVMMVFRSINFTQEKKIVDLGPLEVNKKEEKTVNWPLYAGIVVTVAGVVVFGFFEKKQCLNYVAPTGIEPVSKV